MGRKVTAIVFFTQIPPSVFHSGLSNYSHHQLTYQIARVKTYLVTYVLVCPFPYIINFVVVSSSTPIGPNAWSFEVLMPISAPSPSSKPSLNLVDAFTKTVEEFTPFKKLWAFV